MSLTNYNCHFIYLIYVYLAMSHAISFQMAGLDQLFLISASLIKFGIYTPRLAQWLYKSPINNLHLRPDFPQVSFSKQCGTATWTAKCDSLPASGLWRSARWDCWWGGADRAAPWHVAQPEDGPLWTTTLGLDRKPGTVGWVDSAFLYEAAWLLEVRICP